MKLGDRVQIHIDRLAIGGRGVGRLSSSDPKDRGIVIFVEGATPQEDLEAEITLIKKNFAEAKLVRVIEPSPFRVTPPCPIADRCGGCSWQHISYEEQLRQKQALVAEALRKFSGFVGYTVAPVIPSPNPFRYRNRIQVHRRGSTLGFYARGTHQIIDATDCLITEEDLTKRFSELRGGQLQNATDRVQIYRDQSGQINLSGAGNFSEALGFSQVNSAQNENLIHYLLQAFKKRPAFDLLLDLYSGSGNFTFPLAAEFKAVRIQSVELSSASVKAGIKQVRDQKLENIQFFESSVEAYLRKIQRAPSDSLAILLDPPRAGCGDEVMQAVLDQRPTTLVYVSCHPVTLGRDLQLLAKAGFQLIEVQPFDMFPQTDHVETVVVLKPSEKS